MAVLVCYNIRRADLYQDHIMLVGILGGAVACGSIAVQENEIAAFKDLIPGFMTLSLVLSALAHQALRRIPWYTYAKFGRLHQLLAHFQGMPYHGILRDWHGLEIRNIGNSNKCERHTLEFLGIDTDWKLEISVTVISVLRYKTCMLTWYVFGHWWSSESRAKIHNIGTTFPQTMIESTWRRPTLICKTRAKCMASFLWKCTPSGESDDTLVETCWLYTLFH